MSSIRPGLLPAPIIALLLSLALVASCRTGGLGREPDEGAPSASGELLYQRYCAACHGMDGRTVVGVTAPSVRNPAFLALVSDDFLHQSIARGRPGRNAFGKRANKMSLFGVAEGGPLSAADIDRIVAHVRRWQSKPAATPQPFAARGDAERGRAVYGVCAPCHGPDGWSLTAPSMAGSTFQQVASDGWIRHLATHGRADTQMSGFALADSDVADLIAFVRTLDDAEAAVPAQPQR